MEALDIVTKAAEHANEKMKQTVRERKENPNWSYS